jgi:hypothetical protein
VETWKPQNQKDIISDGLTNESYNRDIEVSESMETTWKPPGNPSLAEFASRIRDILQATKDASRGELALLPNTLAKAACENIKREHPKWRDVGVLKFYKQLVETDPTIQGLKADWTGGPPK